MFMRAAVSPNAVSLVVIDRPHRRSRARHRNARRDPDGFLRVFSLYKEIAAELLLGFHVGTVGRRDLAVAHAHGGRDRGSCSRLQRVMAAALDFDEFAVIRIVLLRSSDMCSSSCRRKSGIDIS